jgi:cephalosporin hydroxylase
MRAFEVLKDEGVDVFLRKALAYVKREFKLFLILPYALVKVKRANFANLDDLVDFSFHGVGGLIQPMQVRDEILSLLKILEENKPKVIIEIGTAMGGTLFLLCRVASKDATIISIDLPGARFGYGYYWWRIPLYKTFRLPKQKLHLIRADSHSKATLERVRQILNGRKVDFLLIDGDHSYEGVKKDFEMFNPLVKKGGTIAFHDIVTIPSALHCEANKFWDELKQGGYKYIEIVSDWKQGMCGIGLLQWLT